LILIMGIGFRTFSDFDYGYLFFNSW
jgi:hypothetical protein